LTTELDHEFLLSDAFDWNGPIAAAAQTAVAAYGSDEDRVRLAGHASVTPDTLDALSLVPSVAVRFAVAGHPATPLDALVRLNHDRDRAVKAAAHQTIDELPEDRRLLAKSMVESPLQRLMSRRIGSRAA
jgi:Leucine rich repeat variant